MKKIFELYNQLDLYNLHEITNVVLLLMNLNKLNPNLKIIIISFSISSLYDNYLNKNLYIIDFSIYQNKKEKIINIDELIKILKNE